MSTTIPTFDIIKDKLMSKNKICAQLEISPETFDRFISTGYFPPHCLFVSGSARWKASVVNAWLRREAQRSIPLNQR